MSDTNAEAGPSQQAELTSQLASISARPSQTANKNASVPASKLAKNKRLPATMITPSGQIESSKKKKDQGKSKKQKQRNEKGRERAVELAEKLGRKAKENEDKKAKRNRAKKAWE
ncbi:hypothetical protein P7C73_g1105, partial [Tremellales sp. Uapishka_1]